MQHAFFILAQVEQTAQEASGHRWPPLIVTLFGVVVLVYILAKFFGNKPQAKTAAAPEVKPSSVAAPAVAAPAQEAGISPEIIAVIAAAVAATTGGRKRIVSIRPEDSSWGLAGRQSILGSHRLR